MLKEKKLNEDIQNLLKEQVEFLKQESTVKNSLIESILTELYNKNNSSYYHLGETTTDK